MQNIARVRALIWGSSRSIAAVVFFYGFCISALSLAIPLAVQGLVNSIAFSRTLQPIFVLSVILFASLVLSGFIRSLQAAMVDLFHRKIVAVVVPQIYVRLRLASERERSERDLSELSNRYFDIFVAQKSLSLLFTDGFSFVLQLLVGLTVVAFYHPFFLLFALVILAIFGVIVRLFNDPGTTTAIGESKAKYKLGALLQRTASSTDDTEADVAAALQAYDRSRATHFRYLLWQIIALVTVQAIGGAAFLGLGGWVGYQSTA